MLSFTEDNLDNEELDGIHSDNNFINQEGRVLLGDIADGRAAASTGWSLTKSQTTFLRAYL